MYIRTKRIPIGLVGTFLICLGFVRIRFEPIWVHVGHIWDHFGPMGLLINPTQTRIERFWANGARRGPERDRKRRKPSFRTLVRRKGKQFSGFFLFGPLGALKGT